MLLLTNRTTKRLDGSVEWFTQHKIKNIMNILFDQKINVMTVSSWLDWAIHTSVKQKQIPRAIWSQ